MKLVITMLLILSACCPSAAAGLRISKAYYRDTNASLHLFLVNKGTEPVSVLPPVVNGLDCASLGRDGRNVRDVLWYRCRPNPIGPGEIADLTITLAEPTDKPVTVELTTPAGQKLRKTIKCVPEAIRFQAIRFSRDLRTVDLYVRSTDTLTFRRARMDGKDVGKLCRPWPAQAFNGIAFTRIRLSEPLAAGSFHVFEIEAEDEAATAYQIRAIPAEFLIGVYGVPSAPNLESWEQHGVDHHISFGAVNAETLDLCAEHSISVGSKYIAEHLSNRETGEIPIFDENAARKAFVAVMDRPSLLYHHLVDEPDVSDYYVDRTLGSTGMELAARAEFCEETDPGRYTFVQLDNTFRPRNYRVYGESADLLATHRYSLGNYLSSEAGERVYTQLPFLEDMLGTMTAFRQAVEPKPFFMVTQFFNLGERRSGRPPTVEEMRLQCYIMIAGGARGVLHYIHSGSGGGGEGGRSAELWDRMTSLHAELNRVGEFVTSGTPAPQGWVTSSSANLISDVMLCGDDMAVIFINRSHRSARSGFTAVPVRGASVSIRVPPWTDASSFEVVPAEGGEPLKVARKSDRLNFTLDEVAVARCLLIGPRR